MNTNRFETGAELRRLRGMMHELGELAEHATMTGSLEGGPAAVRRYNAILQRLQELDAAPSGFAPLGSDAGFDALRVECKVLARSLEEDDSEGPHGGRGGNERNLKLVAGLAPFVDQRELIELLRQHEQAGELVDPRIILALAPFLPKGEVTRLVRQHLGLGPREDGTGAPNLEVRPAPQRAEEEARPVAGNESNERHEADLDARIDALSIELRQADLTDDDRVRLADELARAFSERARPQRGVA